jgi:geranylgeranyl diphosphate synthase type II
MLMSAVGFAEEFESHCRRLRELIEQQLARCTQYGPDVPPRLGEAIRHSLFAPAKRLRPLLVLLACEACGKDPSEALAAASAVEFIHTYSLIHDDLPAMDNDDLRRGRPTCHVAFDEATAILAGDAMLAQAFEIVASGVPAAVLQPCLVELGKAAGPGCLVGGQYDDLNPGDLDTTSSLSGLERIHRRKTGALIKVSLRMGGLIGQGTPEQLAALERYGDCLGLAFQIVDDLLDLRGEESKMGKKTGKDSAAGKLTYPGLLGEEASRERAAGLIDEARQSAAVFGERALHLDALARFVLDRTH